MDTYDPTPALQASASYKLPSFKTELALTVELLKMRILTFILVGAIGILAVTLTGYAWLALCKILMLRVPPFLVLLLPVLWLPLGLVPMLWMTTAFYVALDKHDCNVWEAYKSALPKLLGMVWVLVLFWFLATGGLALLILPGLFLFVLFFYAPYIFVGENRRGLNALVQSREYVRGRFTQVALRLLGVWVGFGILGAIVTAVLSFIPAIGPPLGIFVSLLIGVFCFVYSYVLYQSLRARPTISADTLSRRDKLKSLAPGLILSAPVMVVLLGASIVVLPQKILATKKMIESPMPGTGAAFKDILLGPPLGSKASQKALEKAAKQVMNQGMKDIGKQMQAAMQASGQEIPKEMQQMMGAMQKGMEAAVQAPPQVRKAAAAAPKAKPAEKTPPPSAKPAGKKEKRGEEVSPGWELPEDARNFLIGMLRDKDWRTRRDGAKELGKMGSGKDLIHLEKLLRDRHDAVYNAASEAIRKIRARHGNPQGQ